MTETTNSISALKTLKGSVTYKCSESSGQFTVIVVVDGESYPGHGFSLESAKENAATNALKLMEKNLEIPDDRSAFYILREKRRGLIFQSIRKNKGSYDVCVQVDFVKYFGKGKTQPKANNSCAANVLAAFDSGEHEKRTQALYRNAFKALKKMYDSLMYRTLASSDDKFEVYVNVDGIDYFGEGQSVQEGNNDAAWTALKSIWSGEHKRQLDEIDEYWYDDDDYSSSISSEFFVLATAILVIIVTTVRKIVCNCSTLLYLNLCELFLPKILVQIYLKL